MTRARGRDADMTQGNILRQYIGNRFITTNGMFGHLRNDELTAASWTSTATITTPTLPTVKAASTAATAEI